MSYAATTRSCSHEIRSWLPGDVFGPPDVELQLLGGTRVEIVSFDEAQHRARIRVRVVAPRSATPSA